MKPKTHKATAKRLKITPRKKIVSRRTRQDHFNARESGEKTRTKRKAKTLHKSHLKKVKKYLPHSF